MTDEEAWKQVIKFDKLIKWLLFVKYGKHTVMFTGLSAKDVIQECRISAFKAIRKKGDEIAGDVLVHNAVKWRLFRLLDEEKIRKKRLRRYGKPEESYTLEYDEDNSYVYKLLGWLHYRERMIIQLRFGIRYKQEHTLSEVGKIFGITKERVRQIESKALHRLKYYKGGDSSCH